MSLTIVELFILQKCPPTNLRGTYMWVTSWYVGIFSPLVILAYTSPKVYDNSFFFVSYFLVYTIRWKTHSLFPFILLHVYVQKVCFSLCPSYSVCYYFNPRMFLILPYPTFPIPSFIVKRLIWIKILENENFRMVISFFNFLILSPFLTFVSLCILRLT